MAKINVTRIIETSKFLATEAGKSLADFITYVAEALSQVIIALRNGLTFQDNFNSQTSEIEIVHGVAQSISTSGKTPRDIFFTRSFSFTNPIESSNWQIGSDGNVQILVYFKTSVTTPIRIRLVILF